MDTLEKQNKPRQFRLKVTNEIMTLDKIDIVSNYPNNIIVYIFTDKTRWSKENVDKYMEEIK